MSAVNLYIFKFEFSAASSEKFKVLGKVRLAFRLGSDSVALYKIVIRFYYGTIQQIDISAGVIDRGGLCLVGVFDLGPEPHVLEGTAYHSGI
jgi:hypothetical protein